MYARKYPSATTMKGVTMKRTLKQDLRDNSLKFTGFIVTKGSFSKGTLKQDEHWNETLATRDSNPERKEMGVKSSPQYGWAAK